METTLQRKEKGNGWWGDWGAQSATVSTLDFDGLQTGLTVQRLVSEKPCLAGHKRKLSCQSAVRAVVSVSATSAASGAECMLAVLDVLCWLALALASALAWHD